MDISEINFCDYIKQKNIVVEIKKYVKENRNELNSEFTKIAPLYKLSEDEYMTIINRCYNIEDDLFRLICIDWKKDKQKGVLRLLNICYIWQLKGGKEFLKRIKKRKK